MLEKPEEKEFHKKWESLYVFTGRRSDLTTMISIAVINPMILYQFPVLMSSTLHTVSHPRTPRAYTGLQ